MKLHPFIAYRPSKDFLRQITTTIPTLHKPHASTLNVSLTECSLISSQIIPAPRYFSKAEDVIWIRLASPSRGEGQKKWFAAVKVYDPEK